MYYRKVGNLPPSNMLLLTKSDGEFCARELGKSDPIHWYEAQPRFLGYEGADYGVTKYKRNSVEYESRFCNWVPSDILREMCRDRPIVPQDESFN